MKKWLFLLAFSVFLVGFHAKSAHAEMPCGSYGLSASDPCVPTGDQMCQEELYNSSNTVVPGTEQCNTSTPVGGVNRWTNSIGQSCEQAVNPDGTAAQAAQCVWPAKQESVGDGCDIMVYAAGPQAGQPVGQAWCPGPATAPIEHLKTWINP